MFLASITEFVLTDTTYSPSYDVEDAPELDLTPKGPGFTNVFCTSCCVGMSFMGFLTLFALGINLSVSGEWYGYFFISDSPNVVVSQVSTRGGVGYQCSKGCMLYCSLNLFYPVLYLPFEGRKTCAEMRALQYETRL